MALQDITQKIIDDARAQCEEIVASTQAEIRRLKADAEEAQKTAERKSDVAYEERMLHEEHATLSRARRESAQALSTAKRTAIDAVLADVRTQIVTADDAFYTAFLERMIEVLPDEAKTMTAVAHVPPARVALTRKSFSRAHIVATVEADEAIDAGFVIVGATADYDATLHRHLVDHGRIIESQVAQSLFSH